MPAALLVPPAAPLRTWRETVQEQLHEPAVPPAAVVPPADMNTRLLQQMQAQLDMMAALQAQVTRQEEALQQLLAPVHQQPPRAPAPPPAVQPPPAPRPPVRPRQPAVPPAAPVPAPVAAPAAPPVAAPAPPLVPAVAVALPEPLVQGPPNNPELPAAGPAVEDSAAFQQVKLYLNTILAMATRLTPPALDVLLGQVELLNDTARACKHPQTEKIHSVFNLMQARSWMGAAALSELFITYLGTPAQREFLASVNAFDKRQSKKVKESPHRQNVSNRDARQPLPHRSPLNPSTLAPQYRQNQSRGYQNPSTRVQGGNGGGPPRGVPSQRPPRRCYQCGSTAHLLRSCPSNRQ